MSFIDGSDVDSLLEGSSRDETSEYERFYHCPSVNLTLCRPLDCDPCDARPPSRSGTLGAVVADGKQYAVAFERRDTVSTVGSIAAGGECEWEETLSLDCTMYRDEKGMFEEKIAKLSVNELSATNKTVGAVSFDLKDYCDESEEGLTNTVALSLSVGGVKKQGAGTLYVTISTHQVEEQPVVASRDRSSTRERSSQFEVMGLKSELEKERAAKKALMEDQNRLLKVVRTLERKDGASSEEAIAAERKRREP